MFESASNEGKIRNQVALVCLEGAEETEDAVGQLEALGFRIEKIAVERDAVTALHNRRYDLIMLPDTFRGGSKESNLVLQELLQMACDIRRTQFCVLVGQLLRTGDEEQAFCNSVDMVINTRDLPSLGGWLQMGISGKQEALSRFVELMHRSD